MDNELIFRTINEKYCVLPVPVSETEIRSTICHIFVAFLFS